MANMMNCHTRQVRCITFARPHPAEQRYKCSRPRVHALLSISITIQRPFIGGGVDVLVGDVCLSDESTLLRPLVMAVASLSDVANIADKRALNTAAGMHSATM